MKTFRKILSIIIYSNTWVALNLSLFVLGVCSYFEIQKLAIFFLWSLTSTIAAYQLHRLFRLKQLQHSVRSNRRLLWMQLTYPRQIAWFILNITMCVTLTLVLPFSLESIYLLLINCVVVGLYALPLPFIGNGIRNLPFLKNGLIALSWTIIIVLPLASADLQIPYLLPILVFIAVFAQIIPFDARDAEHDPASMHTIPQLVGKKFSRIVGFGLLIFALGCQTYMLGFHWMLPLVVLIGAIGHFHSYQVGYQLRLEFLWEFPLGLMGLWFFLV